MKKALTTAYAEEMDKNTPWNEYPRPSMVRGSFLCLNGSWDFHVGDESTPASYGEKILIPFPPESELSGICREIKPGQHLHYRRSFSVPDGFLSDRFILHFGAVDTICDVFLNGIKVAHHEGGYLPFLADCTDALAKGENELYVRVKDEISPLYPYGKQTKKRGGMWYTPVSGIWQTVWAEAVPENYIEALEITSSMTEVTVSVIGGCETKKLTIKETGEIFEFSEEKITFTPSIIKHWSPETPYLYNFTLESGKDTVDGYFALREIGIGDFEGVKKLTLNGKPYIFNGLLDQGYFPDGIFLPATSRGYEDDILNAKALGFNMLRKHIKVEPEIFYHLCDKLGIVVFQDMVNNAKYSFFFDTVLPTVGMKRFPDKLLHRSKHARRIFREHSLALMDHLHNFPCILYYTIFNEGWGQFCADEMYDIIKAHDSTRIIDSTSGWFVQNKSDVDSHHIYFKPLKLKKFGTRPVVISEFGGYSHRVEGHLFGDGNYGYRLFKSREEFEKAVTKLYAEEVLPLAKRGVSAFVYTQVSDVEDETNGFLTYDRRFIKVDANEFRALMDKIYSIYN